MAPGFEHLAREADRLLRAGQWQAALRAVDAALVVAPDWSRGLREAGGLALRLGNPGQSISRLRRAIGRAPDDPRCWLLLARARQARSGAGHALDAARRAAVLDPGHREALSFLAAGLASREDNQGALVLLERLGRVAPPSLFDLKVGLHARLAVGDLSGGSRAARLILARSPDDPQALEALGRVSRRRRDHRTVWRYVARMGVLKVGDPETLTAMSRAALGNAMVENAAGFARKAILAGAAQGESHLDLARALWRLEGGGGANKEIDHAIDRAINRARLVDPKAALRGRVLRLTVTKAEFAAAFQRNSVNTPV